MADIFISYAREDRKKVELLVNCLEAEGWSVWWDKDLQSRAGDEFDEVIEKELEAARCVVTLWSKHSAESRWVRTETGEGAERKILVPIKVQKGIKPPLAFRRLQTADLSGWRGSPENPQIVDVLNSIRGVLEGREVSEVSGGSSGSSSSGPDLAGLASKWWWAAAVVVIGVVLYFAWPRPPGPPDVDPVPEPQPRLAVRPLRDLSPDRTGAQVGDRMTQDLIISLHKIPGLTVTGFGAVQYLKVVPEKPYAEVGRELQVSYILDGTVTKGEDGWLVITQLNRAEPTELLWSQPLEQSLEGIQELKDSLVQKVAENIWLDLHGEDADNAPADAPMAMAAETTTRRHPDAYDAYLEGLSLLASRTPQGIEMARALLRDSVQLDPNHGAAWAALADAYRLRALYGLEFGRSEKKAALEAATKAVDLDPSLPSAWATLGDTRHFQWHRAEAEEAFGKAIELNPSYATALQWYAQLLVLDGRVLEGVAMAARAVELAPMSAIVRSTLSNMQYLTGEYEAAEATSRSGLEQAPHFWVHRVDLSQALSMLGEHEDAETEARRADDATGGAPRALVALATALARSGKSDEALAELEENRTRLSLLQQAWIEAVVGDAEAALDLLEEGLGVRESWLILAPSIPDFDSLEETPRGREFFAALDAALNSPSAQE